MGADILGLQWGYDLPGSVFVYRPSRSNAQVLQALRKKRDSMRLRYAFVVLRYLKDRERMTCIYPSLRGNSSDSFSIPTTTSNTNTTCKTINSSTGDSHDDAMCIIRTVNITEIPFHKIISYLDR
jgi:hypothetical protein